MPEGQALPAADIEHTAFSIETMPKGRFDQAVPSEIPKMVLYTIGVRFTKLCF
jgi:hypothetical protein